MYNNSHAMYENLPRKNHYLFKLRKIPFFPTIQNQKTTFLTIQNNKTTFLSKFWLSLFDCGGNDVSHCCCWQPVQTSTNSLDGNNVEIFGAWKKKNT